MKNNKLLVIGNWKCNPTILKQAEALFSSIKNGVGETKNTEIIICPPFPFLNNIGIRYPYKMGGQNCFWEQSGPFTGEISPEMLKNLGCEYVILGHSERRTHLGETDEMISKKLVAAFDAGIIPILCIGETEEQRKQGKTEEILRFQLMAFLKEIPESLIINNQLLIAYEPIWAIGTGNACQPKDAQQVLSFLKRPDIAYRGDWKIVYGGSVDDKNAKHYIDVGFEGLLIGGVSLDAEQFIKIIKALEKK